MIFHDSVLLQESIEALAIRSEGTYVDATYGGGGHSKEILKHLKGGKLFAFDQDAAALNNTVPDRQITMINSNFRYIRNFLKLYKAVPVDGILADLGVSSHQIDDPERGFSTRFEGELDMRMDTRKSLTAKEIINHYHEEKLIEIFRTYGELTNAKKIARSIVSARKEKEIRTTVELKEVLTKCFRQGHENKFFAQVFQSVRIETNQELEALKDLLVQSVDLLKQGGRIVILAYHSLEDRLVKDFFRSGNFQGEIQKDFFGNPVIPLRVINRKPIVASENEIAENRRARSVRLRIAEKI
jgi:16S rRNA (cytosine1402-N4)-methyltransferase